MTHDTIDALIGGALLSFFLGCAMWMFHGGAL